MAARRYEISLRELKNTSRVSAKRMFSFVQFLYITLLGSTLLGQDSGHWHRVFIKKQKKQTWPVYGI